MTISPGAILKFMPSTHLDVRGGFVADDVVFTSWRDDVQGGDTNCDGPSSGESGDWQGIHFYDAAGGGSFIDCLVRYAGQHISTPTGGRWGITARNCPGPVDLTNVTVEHTGSGDWAVYLDTPGTISGCTVRDNLGNGLWIAPSDDTTISGNSATGNAGFGYGIHANLLGNFGQNSNTQSENGFGDFVLASPTVVADTATWSGSYDYYFEAGADVTAGATLTISPGAILKFMPSTHLDVRGGFVADDVVFTSWRDDSQGGDTNSDGPSSGEPGDWQGIHFFDAAGGGAFTDCLVRYAGQHISTPTGGNWGITARSCPGPIDLTNVTVEYTGSGDWAVYLATPGTISGCVARDNLGNGINIDSSDTHLTTTDIYNDSGIGLQYTPADTLIAANCYWGHATGPQHTDNPGGLGTVVTGNVDFIPWSELPNTLVLDVVVQGIVSDLVTEQPITGAQVTLLPLFSGSSTITNEAGFWSLDAPDGSGYSLTVVAEGYDDYLAADLSFESGQVYQLDVQMTQSVSIDDGVPLPRAVSLEQNCPNPFNPRTEIRFSLPASDHISLKIYDIQGRLVKVLVDGVMPAGIHGEVWLGTDEQGRQVTSGIYMYLLETSGGVWSKSMVVLK
ncbi:MAG: T9SS type A sorting domain-containing protein [Proteobacteria bacterium]|nr:T9SS type A sorting domain-containing protein [Pseudomonadota bacterium]